MGMNYEEMLEKLYSSLRSSRKDERFELPTFVVEQQGKKTIIKNFLSVAKTLRRDPQQLYRFLQKELAVPISLSNNTLHIGGRFSSKVLNTLLEKYEKIFVICKICNKPDTHIEEINEVIVLKCEACGAITPIKYTL